MRRRETLIRELPSGDDVSARMLHLHARHPGRYPAFLDSAATGGSLGRYSILVAAPGEQLILGRNGQLSGPGAGTRFCERLNEWWCAEQGPAPPPPWPFAGGWFLYLGYELAGEVEPTLRLPPSPLPIVAMAWRMRAALVHDNETGRSGLFAEPGAEAHAERLAAHLELTNGDVVDSTLSTAVTLDEDEPTDYLEACRRALAHIAAGDVYQANLARRWRVRLAEGQSAGDLYRRLRAA